jgi:glycosyltransferase involved in cell wall biosynthesis
MLVSVVVRSYNRLPALCELVTLLLDQDHPSYEVVVVDQSTDVPPEADLRLRELEADPRLRVLRFPPLGGARARNAGARAARGEILLLIDDDDLPVGRGWISAHAAAYDDPNCIGMSGRHLHEGDKLLEGTPGLLTRFVARYTLALSPVMKMPLVFTHHGIRRLPVDLMHGTNASLRKSTYERFGPWDERTRIEDEASLCLAAHRGKRPEEYFAYDPRPCIKRRMDLEGGLAKRRMTATRYIGVFLDFVHRILGGAFPVRVTLTYPLFVIGAFFMTMGWLWHDSWGHRSALSRLGTTVALLVTMPVHVGMALYRLTKRLPRTTPVPEPTISAGRASAPPPETLPRAARHGAQ